MEEPKLLAVEEIDTVSIPALVRDRAAGRGEDVTWERDVCINFAGKFLECEFSQLNWATVSPKELY